MIINLNLLFKFVFNYNFKIVLVIKFNIQLSVILCQGYFWTGASQGFRFGMTFSKKLLKNDF